MKLWTQLGRPLVAAGLLLALAGIWGCDLADDGAEPVLPEALIQDGTWDLRVDRTGGSEDAGEAFGFLPETDYRHVDGGPTYRVVISQQGMKALVEGTRSGDHFAVRGTRTEATGERWWYELDDAFAGGRFVVWGTGQGLQGEFTIYGSGRPIISSERGTLAEAP